MLSPLLMVVTFVGSVGVLSAAATVAHASQHDRPEWADRPSWTFAGDLFVTGLATSQRREDSRQRAFLAGLQEIVNYTGLPVPEGVPIATERLYETIGVDGSITTYRLMKVELQSLKEAGGAAAASSLRTTHQEPPSGRPEPASHAPRVAPVATDTRRGLQWPADCPSTWAPEYCTQERLGRMTRSDSYLAIARMGGIPRNRNGEAMFLFPDGWRTCPVCDGYKLGPLDTTTRGDVLWRVIEQWRR